MRSVSSVLRALALLGPASVAIGAQAQPPWLRNQPQPAPNHRSCPAAQPTPGARCGGAVVSQQCSYPASAQLCHCGVSTDGRRWACHFTGVGPTEGPLSPPELA